MLCMKKCKKKSFQNVQFSSNKKMSIFPDPPKIEDKGKVLNNHIFNKKNDFVSM